MDKVNKTTIQFYDSHAKDWAKEHGGYEDKSFWHEEMEIFNKYLHNGRIVEFGSGAGKDAKSLIRMGYEYLGTDASAGLVEVAKSNNPNTKFLVMPLQKLKFNKLFDGFWTAATLLHIPKIEINKILQNIKRVVKKNGIGFISLKAGAGEKTDKETSRWFSYYSLNGFKEILERNGYKVLLAKSKKDYRGVYWLTYWVKI